MRKVSIKLFQSICIFLTIPFFIYSQTSDRRLLILGKSCLYRVNSFLIFKFNFLQTDEYSNIFRFYSVHLFCYIIILFRDPFYYIFFFFVSRILLHFSNFSFYHFSFITSFMCTNVLCLEM